jgi:hypothetical protein
MSTADLQLRTLFVLDEEQRITGTREPGGSRGPLFSLIRGVVDAAWAVRDDVPHELAGALARLARQEPLATDLRAAPAHATQYASLLRAWLAPSRELVVTSGPAYRFPDLLVSPGDVVVIDDERWACLPTPVTSACRSSRARGRRPIAM